MYGECHGHIFMDGVDYLKMKELYSHGICEEDIRRKLSSYQRCGVTYFRDGGDHFGAGMFARKIAGEYGITYSCPVYAIHKNGRYGSIVGRGFSDLREYHALVKEVREKNGDFIKVMFSGIMDFAGDGCVTGTPLSREEIHEMIHIAHEEGFAVMAHVNGSRAIRDAIEGGVDTIEHGNLMDEDCLQALAQSDTVWVPTHVTIANLLGDGRFPREVICRLQKLQSEAIRRAFSLGARIALGSDAGAYRVPHGTGIEDEYRAFLKITRDLMKPEELDRILREGEMQIRRLFPGNGI